MENAKIQNFKWDILSNFQTMWMNSENICAICGNQSDDVHHCLNIWNYVRKFFSWSIISLLCTFGRCTLFQNYSKCRIRIFEFWRFSPFFVLLRLTCLVTLFDSKLQVFKNSSKWTIFGIFDKLLSSQNVNVARFARNIEWDFFLWFSNTVYLYVR